jgi:hypothetical protein
MPDVAFWPAPEVEEVARDVVRRWRNDLVNARVEYVFRSTAEKKNGRKCLATARVVNGLASYYTRHSEAKEAGESAIVPEPFFLVMVWYEAWCKISAAQQLALVDHELKHCVLEMDEADEEVYTIVGHDVEEFEDVASRHGAWMPNLDRLVKATLKGDAQRSFDLVEGGAA